MGFDFKKKDDYKIALDDGFVYQKDEHDGELSFNTDYVRFIENKNTYSFYNIDSFGEVEVYAEDENFDEFKKKVTDFLLNNN